MELSFRAKKRIFLHSNKYCRTQNQINDQTVVVLEILGVSVTNAQSSWYIHKSIIWMYAVEMR